MDVALMYVNEACDKFLYQCKHTRNLSPLTLKAYTTDLAQFRDSIGSNCKVHTVSKACIVNFQIYLASLELSPSSTKRKIACVRALFRWLELDENIELNPFHKVQLDIKLPRRLPRNVPTEELCKLCHQAKLQICLTSSSPSISEIVSKVVTAKELNKLTALLAVELMLSTGIRVSELSGIQLHHLFLMNKKIKILGKGARERFVYLPDNEVCTLVKAYLIARNVTDTDCNILLVNSRGNSASTQFLRKLVKQLSDAAKIPNRVTPHMLRHSTACELLDAGLDIRFVQRLLGHSSISTTEIYTHVSDKSLQEKITKANIRRRVMKK